MSLRPKDWEIYCDKFERGTIFDDPACITLSLATQGVWLSLLALRAVHGQDFPDDLNEITKILRCAPENQQQVLSSLRHLIRIGLLIPSTEAQPPVAGLA